jgi:YegS/Rv2252/BmrU family lipid kinase
MSKKTKTKWAIIINPNAGKTRKYNHIKKIENLLKKHSIRYQLFITENYRQALYLSENLILDGYRKIIAVGGDGTINEVVNGIMNSNYNKEVILAIIPSGSGNDFIKSVNIPKSYKKAIKIIKDNFSKKVSVGKLNNLYFINTLGIGFDAKIAKSANKIKFVGGIIKYLLALFENLQNLETYNLAIKTDNDLFRNETILLSVGNGIFSGGGFPLTPTASPFNSKAEICLVSKISKFELVKSLLMVLQKKHMNHPAVKIFQTKNIEIKSDRNIDIYIDGEIPQLETYQRFSITILPKRINIIVPKETKYGLST